MTARPTPGSRDVVVLSVVRTTISRYGGRLKDSPPADLTALVAGEAVARCGVAPADVGHVVFGNVIHTEARDMHRSRVAAVTSLLEREAAA